MATKVFVRHNFNIVSKALEGISGKTLQKAVARTLKRVSKTVAKVATMEFRSRKLINMKSATLKKRIRVFDHSGPGKLVSAQFSEVHISGKPENLARFYAKRIFAGKSELTGSRKYRVVVSEQGRPYIDTDRAFMIDRGRAGGKVVLERDQGSKRLPVHKLTGPSLGKLASDSGMLPQLQSITEERYEKEFTSNLDFYIGQAVRKASSR